MGLPVQKSGIVYVSGSMPMYAAKGDAASVASEGVGGASAAAAPEDGGGGGSGGCCCGASAVACCTSRNSSSARALLGIWEKRPWVLRNPAKSYVVGGIR